MIGDGRVVGPYFFDVNISWVVYLNMINEQVVPELMEMIQYNMLEDVLFPSYWWLQDGAGAHRAVIVNARLNELFQNIIALNHDIEWPARSPDLTPCDFFCGGT